MQIARKGSATLVICSTVFEALGHAQAKSLGMPDLPVAVIPHPFGLLSRTQVRLLAEQCLPQIPSLVAGRKA